MDPIASASTTWVEHRSIDACGRWSAERATLLLAERVSFHKPKGQSPSEESRESDDRGPSSESSMREGSLYQSALEGL